MTEEIKPEVSAFNKEQLEQLQILITNAQVHTNNPTPQCSISQKGNYLSALNAEFKKNYI